MTFTERAVFGDGADGDIRESGTGADFERLCAVMAEGETAKIAVVIAAPVRPF
ncbi:hypothetical protein [Agrobacterium tumefaciens]|uniref:hypothetical protein n=1 Tax=Agrobacterium tumefaciens TaxID=358 RepID=UPI001F2E5702|nr:hypothetical protein [Agrobacterium tumefaciens]